jgi:hypothetical protein
VEHAVVHTDYVLPYAAGEVDDVVDEVVYDTHTDSVDDTQHHYH